MKQESILKQRAALAKRRLQSGYSATRRFGDVPINIINRVMTLVHNEDLVIRICDYVQKDEELPNPISYFIDKESFINMTQEERQRYIFKVSEAYIFIKNAYNYQQIYK